MLSLPNPEAPIVMFAPFAANSRFQEAARSSPPMMRGAHGSHVALLQGALMDLGARMPRSVRSNGSPDGIFGAETFHALVSFQTAQKLRADGVAGTKTLTKLDVLMAAKAKPVPSLTFNMFPVPYSAEYTLGTADPPLRSDPGAGPWNSRPKEMVTRAQMASIIAILPVAHVAIGDDAVKHLWHYLGNSGRPLEIDAAGMVREVPSAGDLYRQEVSQAKSFVEKLGVGRHQITSRKMNHGYNLQRESRNWFFAVGGYSAWGKGTVEIVAAPIDQITLDFEYHVYDRYNWDKNKSVKINGITVTDHFMGEFHRQGLAQEYDEVGSFRRKFQWRRGQPIPESQF
jgi:Putative peptidoglycan binding domain